MLTVIEQRTCEAICLLATTLEREVPKITKALESIATDLSHMKPTEFGDACYQAQRAFNLIFNKEGNNA